MKSWTRTGLIAAVGFAAAAGFAAPASAQATRTWVSGVGDDANPCSRTAPCKTFAGAISKTAAGGEINCLDPGGYGGVTITKAITILCDGTVAGVLVAGTGINGIVINAGASDSVMLSGLDIHGSGGAANGIRFIAGGALHVRNSIIRGFASTGIIFEPNVNAELFVHDVTVHDNGTTSVSAGIEVNPVGSAVASAIIENVRVNNSGNSGIRIDAAGTSGTGSKVAINNSEVSGSAFGIIVVTPSGTAPMSAMITNSLVANNSSFGIAANGPTASGWVGNTTVTGNTTGVFFGGGGSLLTYGTNRLDGNGAPGSFSGSATQQ